MKRNMNGVFIVALASLVLWVSAGIGFCAGSEYFSKKEKFGFKLYLYNFYGIASVGQESIDKMKLCAVGNLGTICLSEDGGQNWHLKNSGVKTELYDVKFAGPMRGWVVGRFGTILQSDDGGKNWEKLNSGTERSLLSLCVVDETHLWTVGEWGTILSSEDGRTWTSQRAETDKIFNDIFFVDETHGWVVGEFGVILHTEDGGKDWKIQQSPLETLSLFGVFFKDRENGWAVSMDGHIIVTEDGGQSWSEIESPTKKSLFDVQVKGDRAFAFGLEGTFIISDDGGKTWRNGELSLETLSWISSSTFDTNSNSCVIAGGNGMLMYKNEHGALWHKSSWLVF